MVLALLLALSLTALRPAAAPAVAEAPPLDARLDEVFGRTAEVRNLEILAPVDRAIISREEHRQATAARLSDPALTAELQQRQRVLQLLGVLTPEQDLGQISQVLAGEGIIGYYDAESKQLRVIDDGNLDNPDLSTFAHEYTHALQDQHFDLRSLGLDVTDNDDRATAVRTLVEGDAMVATSLYARRYPQPAPPPPAAPAPGLLESIPPFLLTEFVFPYVAGPAFVGQLYVRGRGWGEVDAAFTRLPASTEQVLHVQKYLDGEQPVAIDPARMQLDLGPDWETGLSNTLGELDLLALLSGHLDRQRALSAAAGWGGDRYTLYQNPRTGEALLAILTAWDSESEAAEFAEAFQDWGSGQYGPAVPGHPGTLWAHGEVTGMARDQDRVAIVIGPTPDTIETALAALLSAPAPAPASTSLLPLSRPAAWP